MDMVEFDALYNNIKYVNKDQWEMMRLQTFILKQDGHLRKNCKIKDVIEFPWEKFNGNVKADAKLVEQYKKFKQNFNQKHKQREEN